MRTTLQARITGQLPVYSFTSDDSKLLDYYNFREIEFMFCGCLDASHVIPAGHIVRDICPRVATVYRQGVNHA
jgi:hypothetical protein